MRFLRQLTNNEKQNKINKLIFLIIILFLFNNLMIFSIPFVSADQNYPEIFGDNANTSEVNSSCGGGAMELIWKSENNTINIESYSAPKSSPVVVDDIVYIGDDSGEVHALYLENGTSKWCKKIAYYREENPHGIHSTPCVANGVVYIGTYTRYLFALNATDGSELWKYGPIGSAFGSSPHYFNDTIMGERIYISGDDDWVYCISSSGSLIWREHNAEDDMHSSIGLDNNRGILCVGSNDYKIYGLNMTNGNILWTSITGKEVKASPVIDQETGKVYVGSWDRNMYCLDIETGERLWDYKTSGMIYSSVALDSVNDRVYFASYNSYLYCLDGSNGRLIWKFQLNDRTLCSPTVDPIKGLVFIGDHDGFFYCLDANTGNLISRYKTEGRISASPAIVEDLVIISSCDGYVYCFKSTTNIDLVLFLESITGILISTSAFVGLALILIMIGKRRIFNYPKT